MTRQEELIKSWCNYRGKCSTEIMQALALAFALRWCDEHPNWISVEDELPEVCVSVLTTTKNGTQRVGFYEDGWWLANSPNLVRMGSITHWMRIEPPAKLSNVERIGKNWKEKKGGEQ